MSSLTLDQVRAEADALGIKYHHRAGVEKIQGLINEALVSRASGGEVTTEAPANARDISEPGERWLNGKKGELLGVDIENAAEYSRSKRDREAHLVGDLVRCRVTCMDPSKKDWPGTLISVGSKKLGTFKKFIPHDGQVYHIPRIIYDELKNRQCTVFYNVRDKRNGTIRKAKLINAYAIEVLPPLTPQELDDLRIQQAMAKGEHG